MSYLIFFNNSYSFDESLQRSFNQSLLNERINESFSESLNQSINELYKIFDDSFQNKRKFYDGSDSDSSVSAVSESFLVVEEEGKIGMIQWRWYNCYVIMDGYIVLCCVLNVFCRNVNTITVTRDDKVNKAYSYQ